MAVGQKSRTPVNIPIPTKIDSKWVVHLPQNGTIGVYISCTPVNIKIAGKWMFIHTKMQP